MPRVWQSSCSDGADRLPIADIVNAQVISLEDAPKGYSEGAAVKFVLDPHGMIPKAA